MNLKNDKEKYWKKRDLGPPKAPKIDQKSIKILSEKAIKKYA